jgi:hypothetical protein
MTKANVILNRLLGLAYLIMAFPIMGQATQADASWYAFQPTNDPSPGEIGMQAWLDKPAGQHGRIACQEDKLVYQGRPIKFWGINLCYRSCAPDKKLAEKRAAFYAKYGVNSVRLHKYADGPDWAGIQSKDSFVQFDSAGLDCMDYQIAQFKKQGIYVLLSPIFGSQKLGPGDRQYVPYLDEFGKMDGNKNRVATPHSAVQYAPELQDVQIRQMVNLMQHRNPYTGLSYAEDPAIAFIEIINEQSILFYTSMNPLKASATLRRDVARRFSAWLHKRYASHAQLQRAWGPKALDSFASEGLVSEKEQLDRDNILPLGNPWYWNPAQLEGSQAYRKRRLLDSLEFLYEQQCAFYERYVQAVRKAGYEGEVLGSNWQAGEALSHYYNLHSDYRVGTIDRHNYFGGGKKAKFNNASMLRVPGSGMLSVGMQQVADRPFMLSEWIHVFPNEWGVEGPAIIGAYGMGLQGWDVSYMFQNRDQGGFSERIGRDQWDVTAPQVWGVFPAIARQVLRGDILESNVHAVRKVHVASMAQGKLGFQDRVVQHADVKGFDSDRVPAETLAVARTVIEFTDTWQNTASFDVEPYQQENALCSSTGELCWHLGKTKHDGYFTVDTAATKAVVGFAQGQSHQLGEVQLSLQCPFAALYVTALGPDEDISLAKKLLVVALARARNTGMRLNESEDGVLEPGTGPVLMEAVRAQIKLGRSGSPRVHILDHDGRRTGRRLKVTNKGFEIDGAKDHTPYYLVEY